MLINFLRCNALSDIRHNLETVWHLQYKKPLAECCIARNSIYNMSNMPSILLLLQVNSEQSKQEKNLY